MIVPSTITCHDLPIPRNALLLIGAHELDLFAGIDNHEVGGPA